MTEPQTAFDFLAASPVTEWVPIPECARRLRVPADVVKRVSAPLPVRWAGGYLRPTGQRARRVRLVELGAVRAAMDVREV